MSERMFNIIVGVMGAIFTCACTILGVLQPPNYAVWIAIIGAVQTCLIEICSIIEGKTAEKDLQKA